MLKKIIFLLVFSFSLPAWAGQGDAPLSPPELIPAADHDAERLSMFVTQFFRWWVDNNVRASETQGNTKDHVAVLREREETLKKILMPSLWDRYRWKEKCFMEGSWQLIRTIYLISSDFCHWGQRFRYIVWRFLVHELLKKEDTRRCQGCLYRASNDCP